MEGLFPQLVARDVWAQHLLGDDLRLARVEYRPNGHLRDNGRTLIMILVREDDPDEQQYLTVHMDFGLMPGGRLHGLVRIWEGPIVPTGDLPLTTGLRDATWHMITDHLGDLYRLGEKVAGRSIERAVLKKRLHALFLHAWQKIAASPDVDGATIATLEDPVPVG